MFKLQYKIALLQFLVGCVIVLLGLTAHYQYSIKAIHQEAQTSLQNLSHEIALQVDFVLQEKAAKTKTLTSAPVVETLLLQSNAEYALLSTQKRNDHIAELNQQWMETEDKNSPFIQPFLSNSAAQYFLNQFDLDPGEYGEIFLTNRYGALVASTEKLTTFAHGHKYWWIASYNKGQGKTFFDDRGFDASVEGYVLGIVVPVKKDGQIIGILKSNVRIQGVLDKIVNCSSAEYSSTLIVRDGGTVVLQPGHQPLSTKVNPEIQTKLDALQAGSLSFDDAAVPSFAGFSPVLISQETDQFSFGGNPKSIDQSQGNQGEGWNVVTTESMAHALQLSQQSSRYFYTMNILVVFVLAVIALYIGRLIATPLKKFSEAATSIGAGNFDVKLAVPSQDELGDVAIAFNEMSENLAKTMATKEEYALEIEQRKQAEIERLELETELRQKHKMEAVGRMAGGIAHNFNNNLSIILGNVELSQMKQAPDSEVIPLLENAKIAIRRSRDLVLKIITYSRKGIQNRALIQLPVIVSETVSLLRSTLPTTVSIEQIVSPACDSIVVNADASQIQEVLVNLCNNTVDAMDEKGVLKISLEPVELTQQDIPTQYEQAPGRYAKLSVQDTGTGMPAEMLDKIFDPFYTTKEDYEGAGMGLATVQGIIAQHGGIIKVNSVPDRGTIFDLYFPIIDKTVAEAEPEKTETPKGTEQILFIDDDEMLAEIGTLMLTEMGYQVTMMTESTEALKMFSANADRFDLVITDQTMPDLCGKDLIQEFKKIRADIPTILCTGFSSKVDEAGAKELGISAFCMKPLDLPEFLQTVRQVLDEETDKSLHV